MFKRESKRRSTEKVKGEGKEGGRKGNNRIIEGVTLIKGHYVHVWKCIMKPLTVHNLMCANFIFKDTQIQIFPIHSTTTHLKSMFCCQLSRLSYFQWPTLLALLSSQFLPQDSCPPPSDPHNQVPL